MLRDTGKNWDILRDLRDIEGYWDILRDIKRYWDVLIDYKTDTNENLNKIFSKTFITRKYIKISIIKMALEDKIW